MRFTVKVDKEVDEWLQGDVDSGRFGSKAQAVNVRLKQIRELETKNKDVVAFFIECMELVAEHPEVVETFRKVWKKL